MARLTTKPIGTCTRCRRFDSYRRVNGQVLCKMCGRREKARLATPDPIGRSYHVIAADESLARTVARQAARREGHPTPHGSILYSEDLGPAPRAGRRYEIVIEEASR